MHSATHAWPTPASAPCICYEAMSEMDPLSTSLSSSRSGGAAPHSTLHNFVAAQGVAPPPSAAAEPQQQQAAREAERRALQLMAANAKFVESPPSSPTTTADHAARALLSPTTAAPPAAPRRASRTGLSLPQWQDLGSSSTTVASYTITFPLATLPVSVPPALGTALQPLTYTAILREFQRRHRTFAGQVTYYTVLCGLSLAGTAASCVLFAFQRLRRTDLPILCLALLVSVIFVASALICRRAAAKNQVEKMEAYAAHLNKTSVAARNELALAVPRGNSYMTLERQAAGVFADGSSVGDDDDPWAPYKDERSAASGTCTLTWSVHVNDATRVISVRVALIRNQCPDTVPAHGKLGGGGGRGRSMSSGAVDWMRRDGTLPSYRTAPSTGSRSHGPPSPHHPSGSLRIQTTPIVAPAAEGGALSPLSPTSPSTATNFTARDPPVQLQRLFLSLDRTIERRTDANLGPVKLASPVQHPSPRAHLLAMSPPASGSPRAVQLASPLPPPPTPPTIERPGAAAHPSVVIVGRVRSSSAPERPVFQPVQVQPAVQFPIRTSTSHARHSARTPRITSASQMLQVVDTNANEELSSLGGY
ncbi:hypothetical protein H9P43_005110 [Blastocladiella emersonii ATCC 22665]|nr:hypothetical protein H9P43_005110 [Blastocladiella emersonii ATCC 22665]